MGQVTLSGNLQGGPPSGGTVFPAAQFITPLNFSVPNKAFNSATGVLTRNLSDAGDFVPLSGIGVDVPKVDTLYVKAESDFDIRITQDDGSGGSTVQTISARGLFIMETPNSKQITLVEIAASTKLEYFASGPS